MLLVGPLFALGSLVAGRARCVVTRSCEPDWVTAIACGTAPRCMHCKREIA